MRQFHSVEQIENKYEYNTFKCLMQWEFNQKTAVSISIS